MLARVRRTIEERALLGRGARVVVACSGGPDSAALLHVLTRLDALALRLSVASVDHGLREGSAADVAVARALAERLEVPFAALAVDVGEGASVQARARAARYDALRAHARQIGADAVAVGHTLDDQAETVLSRLLRGASVTGLSGIAPARGDGVVRPLIDCRRDEVRAHVARFDLPHVADPSNADRRFERVRLREALLPALAEEDPNVAIHLAALADEAREIAEWLDAEVAERLGDRRERTEITLDGAPPVRAQLLKRWIEGLIGGPVKRAHLEALRRDGEVLLPDDWIVRRSGSTLRAVRNLHHPTRSRRREG